MIRASKQLFFTAASALDIRWLKRTSPLPLISPYHHVVSNEPIPYLDPLYRYKNTRQFEQDLDFLLTHFQPLTLQEVVDGKHRSLRKGEKGFLLCFDDGLRQAFEVAAPILLRKGVPAALFINPSFVGNKRLFYSLKKGWLLHELDRRVIGAPLLTAAGSLLGQALPAIVDLKELIRRIDYTHRDQTDALGKLFEIDWEDFARQYRPFMTLGEIRAWASKGLGVGSHSMDHPLYAPLSLQEQLEQTIASTEWVVKNVSPGYRAFAFPHVDTGVGSAFFEQMEELDLILGNRAGMMERHSNVVHRFIGENPRIPLEKMVKGVMQYSILRKAVNRQYVER